MKLAMDAAALTDFLAEVFGQVAQDFVIEHAAPMEVRVRMPVGHQHLRPGGTVSGPTMFALADVSVYVAVMAMVGPKALAVTTNASFDFMRKPSQADLICTCKLLKLGKVLAVGDCLLFSDGDPAPVARATMTYSIPQR